MYDMALWKNFSATVYRKLKSAYNKCIKKMFGYTRRDSTTSVFFYLSLPTLDTARDFGSSPYDSLESLVSNEVIWCRWVRRFPSNEGIKQGYAP